MRFANSPASEHVGKMSRMGLMGPAIYKFGGLRIASAFPLFGLQVCRNETEAQCDVVIRCARVPEGAASASAQFLEEQYRERVVLLDYPAVGRFLLRAGKEI